MDYSGESGVDRFVARLKKALAAMPEHEVGLISELCISVQHLPCLKHRSSYLTWLPFVAQVPGSAASAFIKDLGLDPEEVRS